MSIKTTKKKKIISEHQSHEKDTGSTEVQIALLTAKINELTKHLKTHSKDLHSRRGLFKMVGNRRRLLAHLEQTNLKLYNSLVKKLKIRK
ncbi:30S ribosomal protein S15 [candidate division Kazan bacterium]|mgnify:CR=1 FL=1|uniref:Small ribosomal subunit protein uS15 n=1 Tax=candidate division Kazan bacterium TaxID=2202143 RepID=A0A420ZDL8_UNCK3|nr:MAG: 30S ribosomal protein S15 [candidate division Kazan bacterium]